MVPTTLSGTVTKFMGNGRKLGYPTANLAINTELADGVYFGYADMAKWSNHPAIIFVGTPTTLGDTVRRVEAYLLDIPDEDYYEQPLTLTVTQYHRPNETFENIERLLTVMRNDELIARKWFAAK